MNEIAAAKPASIRLSLPLAAFSLEAVKRSAYVMMARASIELSVSNDSITCDLTALSADANLDQLDRDFRREVLDQDLRISISAQTGPLRNAILGLAFSQTGLQG